MTRAAILFAKRLNEQLAPHGAVSEFCRKTGFARATVDRWLAAERAPELEQLEFVAQALGKEPWQLIAPEKMANPHEPVLRELFTRLLAMEQDQLDMLLTHVRIQSEALDGPRVTRQSSAPKKKSG